MILSDISITRPVFASVISLLLLAFGLVSLQQLPLREYPDIDPPVVSITTDYPGASAQVIETRITELIEDRIAGVEGIKFISSSSSDGRSRINVEFSVNRDIEAATNDIRDRVSGVIDNLPEEADPPDVQKSDSSDDVIMWLNLTSDQMDVLDLTDYAKRYLQDRFSVLPGVARVRIGGGLEYAMRIWLDQNKMAAREVTVSDIESALRSENLELPAGSVESEEVQFTVRLARGYHNAEDFSALVVRRHNNYLVRLGEVARVRKEAAEPRIFFRGNGVPMVGIGIIKQSQANTIAVAKAAKDLAERLKRDLPKGMMIHQSYDTSVFIQKSISEVFKTLLFAMALVVTVIYLFLGSGRAMLIPAVTLPVSLVATFIVLNAFGFSINLLTLLALVLAIGLVVDDAVVVLENIVRRIELGEPPLVAAYRGTRQVGFAVIATTLVLVAVFVPITFLEGDLGRLFTEFAMTLAAAVCLSTLVAVTLCAMLSSKLLRPTNKTGLSQIIDRAFGRVQRLYLRSLSWAITHRPWVILVFIASLLGMTYLFKHIPQEYAPKEDRGAFFLIVNGPEGASYQYIKEYMDEIETRLMPYVDSGEFKRLLVRAPRSFGNLSSFNTGIVIIVLSDWSERRPAPVIMGEVRGLLSDLPGVRAFPVMRQAFGGGIKKPVQFVIGGGTYAELAEWRDILLKHISNENIGLTGLDSDYKETKPQLLIEVDKNRAADLGVSNETIGRTLETMLGSRRVTTYLDGGEEYDVILEAERSQQNTATDVSRIYVRSDLTQRLIPLESLVTISERADPATLNRYNRVRAITIEAGLSDGLTLGEALDYLSGLVREHLPPSVVIDYKGESLDYQGSGNSILFIFALGFLVVFLVLAAQFESYVHPMVIILTVPLALGGALIGLALTGNSLNIYTQIGLIMLMGLAAKNGILIVEFINQLRDAGTEFSKAIIEAAGVRLRPILMTGITTVSGAVPLVLATGAGSETRVAIGVVVLFGVLAATFFTLYLVPVAYAVLARNTGSPSDIKHELELALSQPLTRPNTE